VGLSVPAIDQYGQVIDVMVAEKRDLAATRRFFTRALEHGPSPIEVTTDHAAAYPRVLDELVPAACHVTEQYGNNPIESVRREVARNEWITRIGGRYRSTA
jgi:IS6 family transposase